MVLFIQRRVSFACVLAIVGFLEDNGIATHGAGSTGKEGLILVENKDGHNAIELLRKHGVVARTAGAYRSCGNLHQPVGIHISAGPSVRQKAR